MAGIRGFTPLFLLPVILGCFLSASHASKEDVNAVVNEALMSQAPQSEAGFRYLQEPEGLIRESSQKNSGFHEENEQVVFRRGLKDELKEAIESFERAYLGNNMCEELKERAERMVDFVKLALDFVK